LEISVSSVSVTQLGENDEISRANFDFVRFRINVGGDIAGNISLIKEWGRFGDEIAIFQNDQSVIITSGKEGVKTIVTD